MDQLYRQNKKRARPSERWNDYQSNKDRLAFCRRTETAAAANDVAENQSMSEHTMTKMKREVVNNNKTN